MCDNSSSITKTHSLGWILPHTGLKKEEQWGIFSQLDCDSVSGIDAHSYIHSLHFPWCLHTRMRALTAQGFDYPLNSEPLLRISLFLYNLVCTAWALLLFYSSLRVSSRGQAVPFHDTAVRFFTGKLAVLALQCCQRLGHWEKKDVISLNCLDAVQLARILFFVSCFEIR